MQQIYFESYFRGYNRLMKHIYNIAHYPLKQKQIIKQRIKIIKFFDEFGKEATKKAFSKSRSTIFLWKKKLKEGEGRLFSLAFQSKAPENKRQRETDPLIVDFILNYRINILE